MIHFRRIQHMTHYNLIVIGFGKAGKTLAKYASSQGQQVALIEQFTESYGGTMAVFHLKCLLMMVLNMSIFQLPFQEKKK